MRTTLCLSPTIVLSLWMALVCPGFAQAQEVNFSGVWVLDKAYSEILGTGVLDATISITHQGSAVTFKRILTVQGGGHVTLEFATTTDGREVKVKGRYRAQLALSCLYEKGRLIIQREQDGIRISGGKTENILVKVREVCSLSPDGQTLTMVETSKTREDARTREMVFRRKS